ncbi:MAG: hypothetical protein LUQ65_02285 [Candidatus Helarchaeota archaeon]|nr:hypothetical protein [Candidatus Helarchaeota archaeon]
MMNITKIILYKTGLGYFVRKGKVEMQKEKKLQLSFKTNVMNDILKTLSVICSSGVVTGVSYEAADVDTARALEDALIKVPEIDSYLELVKQLIGTQISVVMGSRTLHGKVLGIQQIEEGGKEKSHLEPYLVILTNEGKISNLHIKEISSLEIDDQKMNKELNFFLETIYLGKKKDTKSVTVFFEGTEEAEIFINYLQPMPSWKTSYRLLSSGENDFLIQGWALVDNILDEDWEEIEMSLISGLPISFIYDLYSPNWIARPEVKRVDTFDIKPPAFEEAVNDFAASEDKPVAGKRAMKMRPMMAMADATTTLGGAATGIAMSGEEVQRSTKVSTKGESAGMAGFEYRIMVPVTVKRNQSSLVPILQSKITAKKLCVYNEKNNKTNPMMCLELINDTDLTLESGPISIFDHDAFAGEAMLPFLKESDNRLIAYAVELGMLVTVDSQYRSTNIHEIRIGKYAETFQFSIQHTKYQIKNKTNEEKTVIIEHPKMYQYDLYDTRKPSNETENHYRYELKILPRKTEMFDIKLRRIEQRSLYLNQIAKDDILKWFELKLITAENRDFLLKIFDLELQKREVVDQISKLEQDIQKIVADQERLRENLKSLGESQSESRLKEKYVKKLEEQEESLEKFLKEVEDLKMKKQELEALIQKAMVERQE